MVAVRWRPLTRRSTDRSSGPKKFFLNKTQYKLGKTSNTRWDEFGLLTQPVVIWVRPIATKTTTRSTTTTKKHPKNQSETAKYLETDSFRPVGVSFGAIPKEKPEKKWPKHRFRPGKIRSQVGRIRSAAILGKEDRGDEQISRARKLWHKIKRKTRRKTQNTHTHTHTQNSDPRKAQKIVGATCRFCRSVRKKKRQKTMPSTQFLLPPALRWN